jgi:hypothetical protein
MVGSIYPNGIDGLTQLPRVSDGVSPIVASDVNRIRDAVVAVEKELGINPSGTYGTVKDRFDALDSLAALLPEAGDGYSFSVMLDYVSTGIETANDKTYNLITNIPYDGYMFSVSSKSSAGTCTADVLINGVPLGGGANSVSTTQDVVFHSTDRTFVAGDEIQLELSANAAAVDVVVTTVYLRFVEFEGSSGGGGISPGDGYVQSSSALTIDNSLTRWDGTTGLLIQESVGILDDTGNLSGLNTVAVNIGSGTSTFHVDGSFATAITSISTTPENLTDSHDYILADANSSALILNLPLASTCAGRRYNIKKVDGTSNAVTVARSGSDTIDGSVSANLLYQYQALTFVSNGSNWFIF